MIRLEDSDEDHGTADVGTRVGDRYAEHRRERGTGSRGQAGVDDDATGRWQVRRAAGAVDDARAADDVAPPRQDSVGRRARGGGAR